ncbi:MAG: GNAT family N-acetyltransferase [Bacteroidota bacterium]
MSIPTTFTIETQNYRLRLPSRADFPFIFSATRVEGFNDGMLWEPPETMDELEAPLLRGLEAWKEGRAYGFAIERKTDQQFLGRISIRKTDEELVWNIGFWTHPDFQSQGVMTEVIGGILTFGFQELSAVRITADYATWNLASEKVLHNNGFSFVRFIEHGFQKHGQWIAENHVAIDRHS